MEILNPIRVLLDTSFFVRNNFDFTNRNFKKIKNLSQNKEFEFCITEVIKGEINRKLKELSEKLEKMLYQFQRNCPSSILDLETQQKLDNLKKRIEIEHLVNSFKDYLDEADIKVISFIHSNPEEVFKRYFEEAPPFQMKKDEFPDAFSISMFNNIAKNGLIVSRDNDFDVTEYGNIERNFSSIEDFFDYVNSLTKDDYDLVKQIYNKIKNETIKKIEEGFPNFSFLNFLSSYHENPKLENFYILKEDIISIENKKCVIEVEGQIFFSVELHDSEKEDIEIYNGDHIIPYLLEFSFIDESNYTLTRISPKSGLDTIVAIGEYPE